MKKHNFKLLFILLIIGIGFRTLYLSSGGLTFSYDQGRDAFIVDQILHGDIKIQGPPSSTPGLYHGVFYYYLLTPFYYLGHGNPDSAAIGLAIINSFGICLIYFFSYSITKNRFLSLIASLFYVFSFEQSQYSLWLSNPSYASFTIPLFYFSLYGWIQKKSWAPILSGLSLGLSIQADIFLLYHLPPLIIILLNRSNHFRFPQIRTFSVSLLISLFPMLFSQIKFGFTGLHGIGNLLVGAGSRSSQFTDNWYYFLNLFTKTLSDNLFPLNVSFGGMLGAVIIIWFIRLYWSKPWGQILVLYVLSSAWAVSFGGIATPFLNVGLAMGIYLITVIILKQIYKYSPLLFGLLIFVILGSNILAAVKNNPQGQTIFSLQKDLILKNELTAIDYIYQTQSAKPYSINTITSPLYTNTAWSYLFNWYGLKKYGYLPYWHGHNQIGLLGNNLSKPPPEISDYYLIIDPPEPNFAKFIQPGIEEENGFSKLIKQENFGRIIIQKRIKI